MRDTHRMREKYDLSLDSRQVVSLLIGGIVVLGAVFGALVTLQPINAFELDAAIIFAPVGGLVPVALKAVRKGGAVVCGGIHMSDIPAFPYERLWGERRLLSVANLTRQDAHDYLPRAAKAKVRPHVR